MAMAQTQNTISKFLIETYISPATGMNTNLTDLYLAYTDFCESIYKRPLPKANINQKLYELGIIGYKSGNIPYKFKYSSQYLDDIAKKNNWNTKIRIIEIDDVSMFLCKKYITDDVSTKVMDTNLTDLYKEYLDYVTETTSQPLTKNKFNEKLKDLSFESYKSGNISNKLVFSAKYIDKIALKNNWKTK